MAIALPGLTLVHQLYQVVKAQSHGRKGTHALMLPLENMSHAENWPRREEGWPRKTQKDTKTKPDDLLFVTLRVSRGQSFLLLHLLHPGDLRASSVSAPIRSQP
jgi:hypothetical protein